MNEKESVALFAKGRDGWNAWAKKMFENRKALEADGTWDEGWFESAWNEATRAWHVAAVAVFSKYTFEEGADFSGFVFPGEAVFAGATFTGTAGFEEATFKRFSNFRAIEAKSAFSLARATFIAVPDFIQAHFAEAPRLDDSRIEPRRFRTITLARVKNSVKDNPDLAARWRALKRLAIQGHDHAREQAFFKGELKARRWSDDKPWHAVFWFGVFYQVLSDFGRSLWRPLFWGVVSVFAFACVYIDQHLTLVGQSISGFGWAMDRLGAWLTETGTSLLGIDIPFLARAEAPPLTCVAGAGDPWRAALDLSMHRAFLYAGPGSATAINQDYACLYGILGNTPAKAGDLPAGPGPAILYSLTIPGLAQNVVSAVLIFLFILAVRNHFRIK